ncbi:MAG: ATP-binding cassette domain-containing protein [Spirochaetales bacterium]|nr:ATP-binding cassette domain-containing protein [Spirochaetales bacterium]
MSERLPLSADIHLENLTIIRGGKPILKDINLALKKEKITVIMGASGCGKSTLLKTAAGLIPPDHGKVLVNGKDIYTMNDRESSSLHRQWGFVFQDAALWANRSVLQNLTIPLLYHQHQMSPGEAEERAVSLVRKTGYRDEMHLRPSQLSTGEMMMVSFARAFISSPSVLFLDSPFLAVDHGSTANMKTMISSLRRRGGTVIAIFQDPKYIAQVAEELIIMKDGEILACGAFSEIINTKDRTITTEIAELFEQSASYDGSILDLLSGSEDDPFS